MTACAVDPGAYGDPINRTSPVEVDSSTITLPRIGFILWGLFFVGWFACAITSALIH